MNLIELQVIDVTPNPSEKDSYTLVLGELHGERRIPIIIGGNEAHAIAVVMDKLSSLRPLTHDLFLNVAQKLDFTLSYVSIYKYENDIFYARLSLIQHDVRIEVDSRTSDAVALAVRFKCPIYVTEEIMEQTCASDTSEEADEEEISEEEFDDMARRLEIAFDSIEELEQKLQKAIESEDFEMASIIRDEIKEREKD